MKLKCSCGKKYQVTLTEIEEEPKGTLTLEYEKEYVYLMSSTDRKKYYRDKHLYGNACMEIFEKDVHYVDIAKVYRDRNGKLRRRHGN